MPLSMILVVTEVSSVPACSHLEFGIYAMLAGKPGTELRTYFTTGIPTAPCWPTSQEQSSGHTLLEVFPQPLLAGKPGTELMTYFTTGISPAP